MLDWFGKCHAFVDTWSFVENSPITNYSIKNYKLVFKQAGRRDLCRKMKMYNRRCLL